TEEDFPFLPSQGESSKHQCLDDGTVSLGSPSPPSSDFVQTHNPDDYFASVFTFTDHELDADYIEQGPFRRRFVMPRFFSSIKNLYFYRSVPVALHGLVASLTPTGVQYNFVRNCSCSNC